MNRKYYLFPMMAMTALSLTLAACDDKSEDAAAPADTSAAEVAPTTETATTMDSTTTASGMATTAGINAEGATAYATADGMSNGAVFLTLHNAQSAPDKLVGASTPVASTVELHQAATDASGVATMTKVDAIEIPAGQQITLEPNGYHIMLMGLSAPLAEGTPFDITLDFETAPDVTLPVTVTAASASSGMAPMDNSSMGAGGSMGTSETTGMGTSGTTGMSGTGDTMPQDGMTADESPAMPSATDEPMGGDAGTSGSATDTSPTTTTPPGSATPDMAPTSSSPGASTAAPTAQ